MKKFIIRIVLFIVPVVALLVLTEMLIRDIPNDYKYKSDWLNENVSNITILTVGSSHAYHGIKPDIFSYPSFNAAHPSQSILFDGWIIRKIMPNARHLKIIIWPISYSSLFSTLEGGIEKWRIPYYTVFYQCPYYKYDYHFNNLMFYEHKKKWNFALKSLLHISDRRYCDSLGWGIVTDTLFKNDGIDRAQMHTCYNYSEELNQNISEINDVCKLAKEQNIQILFITTPTTKPYFENLDSTQLNTMYSTIDNIISTNSNTSYINLLDDYRFTQKDFKDSDHLNAQGAEKLTTILNDTIIELYNEIKKN